MQKLLVEKQKNQEINSDKSKNRKKFSYSEITDFYKKNNKTTSLLGLEYERLSLDKNTLLSASYEKTQKIIEHFASIFSWDLIYDETTIIGAKDNLGTSISLEPGCQMEISLAPCESVMEIDCKISKIIEVLDKIALAYDVIFLGYGISPRSCVDDISVLNKRRYQTMNKYLPSCHYGELAPKMMRQSAGIQLNIDYKNETDAYLKLKFFNLIMPFMGALFANSPLENNYLSDKKSIRGHIWRYTGSERCNCFYKNVFSKFFPSKNLFKNYIDEILDVPMIFIERDNKLIEINGKITFREFMEKGFMSYHAGIEDYITHQSLCFPDVRLKQYIEIRNHDSNDLKTTLSLCAFYKGLLSVNPNELLKKVKFLKIEKIEEYNIDTITSGLDAKINNKFCGWDLIAELFNISKKNLNAKERAYLAPVLEMIKLRKTKADVIIDYNISNSKDLVDFLYY